MDFRSSTDDMSNRDLLDLKPDKNFHGYTIVRRLHVGADGEVYSAHDAEGRPCALKIPIARGLGNLRRYASFRTEWELAGKLDHRHVLRFRKTKERFLEMELLQGEDLRSKLHAKKRLGWPEVERCLLEICEALAYIHAMGIVHHDLKPENIMLDRDQGVKLLDFGLAYCRDLDDPLGALPEPIGTPYYIAPEQLEGVRGNTAGDMYSMGVLLYEMLTGELPFKKSTTETGARRRLYVEPVPPRVHRPDLPCGIQELLYALLDRDPFSRPTASNLLQAVGGGIDWSSIACVTPERSALARWTDHFKIWKPLRYKELLRKEPKQVPGFHMVMVVGEEAATDSTIRTVQDHAELKGATVTLMGVIPFNLPDLDRANAEKAIITHVDHWLSTLSSSGIKCRFRIKEGDPEAEILDYIKTRNVDLIVIGQSKPTGLRRILDSGGLTQKIVQHAQCNVLVIKT